MRISSLLAAAALFVAFTLSACDSGSDTSPPANALVVAEPATVALVAERDSLVVDLTAVIRHPDGQALAYQLVSGPPGASVTGTRLVLPPQPPGAVEAVVRGRASTYATATATVRATFAYAGKITAVKAFAPITLDAQRDSALYDLSTYFAAPPGVAVTYTLSSSMPWTLSGAMLKVKPVSEGPMTLTIQANAPGIEPATASLALTGNANWCATAPVGTVDPLPFQIGQTVRFTLNFTANGNYGQYRKVSKGSLTWDIMERTCEYGGVWLSLQAHTVTADTTYDSFAGTKVSATNVSVPYHVYLPAKGVLPAIGQVFEQPVSRRWTAVNGDEWYEHPGAQVNRSWQVRSDASGLALYAYFSGGPGATINFTVRRE